MKPNVVVDERTNVLIVSGNEEELALVRRIIEELDQPEATRAANELKAASAAQTKEPNVSSRAADRLKQLDIQEAELLLRAATEEYEYLLKLHKAGNAGATELQAKQFAVERAKINLMRAQVAGDAKKLFELDLQDAEASLRAAQHDHDRFQAMAKQSPGAISQQEISRAQLVLEKAKINVARARARLESAAEQKPLEESPQRGLPETNVR